MGRLSWLKDARRLSISLTIVAVILYSYSLTQARFEIGFFGSIHSLPLSFFIALSLLTIASAILWASSQPHGKLLFLQLGLSIMALHLTMLAIGGIGASQPNASGLYSEVGLSEYIFRIGHFSPTPPGLWRLNWPGAIILNTAIMLVLGIDDANFILTLNIFIWILLTTPLVYLFLRSTIGKDRVNYCLAGTWIFFLANWFLYYLMPSFIGYLLLLVIMILLAQCLLQKRQSLSFPYSLSLILILLVLPATHLLTSLVALSMLLALYAVRRAKVSGLAMILAISLALWSMYVTAAFFEWRLPLFVEQVKSAFRLDIIWELGVTERIVGSEARQAVTQLRVWFAALFCVIGVAGGITALKDRKISSSDKFVLAAAIGMLTMPLIISEAYEWELIQRAYIFMVPVIAYFGVKLLNHKTTAIILTVLLVVALPLKFISFHGNAIVDYVSPAEIRGVYFVHERHTTQSYVTGNIVHFPLGFMERREIHHFVPIEELRRENNTLTNPHDWPHFIYVRQSDQAIRDFIIGDRKPGVPLHVYGLSERTLSEQIQDIDTITNINLIYTNPDMSIYMATRP